MPTSAEALELAGIPVQRLATYGDSERWQAALRSRGAHHHGDAWILAAPDDVDAGLAAAQLTVAPPPSPAGPAADLLGRMARFSNGADHARRRELVSRLLPPVAEAARHAAGLARRLLREECLPPGRGLQSGEGFLRGQAAGFDLMPVARTLPVRALAAALGLQSSQAERAAALTGQLCDTFAPRLTGARTPSATAGSATGGGCVADAPQSADEAASELCALLSATVPLADTETIAAAAGILFQARDATAALIGLAALALADAPVPGWLPAGELIDSVLRREAPVQCTRRTAAADSTVGGARLPAGADVWIFTAAAERGREVPATFGSGPRGCPGATHAAAVAEVVIEVLSADGWRPAPGQRVELEDRPNIRCPRAVQVRRS